MNADQPPMPPSKSSSKYSSKYQPAEIQQPSVREIRIADILPVVLSAGILALLYFMMKEYNQDKKNTEVHMVSIAKRLEQLESARALPKPPVPNQKVQFKVPVTDGKKPSDDKEHVLEADSKGTFEMKDSVVSFVPETKQNKMEDIDEESESSDTDTEM